MKHQVFGEDKMSCRDGIGLGQAFRFIKYICGDRETLDCVQEYVDGILRLPPLPDGPSRQAGRETAEALMRTGEEMALQYGEYAFPPKKEGPVPTAEENGVLPQLYCALFADAWFAREEQAYKKGLEARCRKKMKEEFSAQRADVVRAAGEKTAHVVEAELADLLLLPPAMAAYRQGFLEGLCPRLLDGGQKAWRLWMDYL